MIQFILKHKPVLVHELIHFLALKPNQNLIDATVGLAGHAKKILPLISPKGKILGIDRDHLVIDYLKKQKIPRLYLHHGNFKNLRKIAQESGFSKVDSIYFDLGLGSWQIENEYYGLSFQKDMPLKMKFGVGDSAVSDNFTAETVVNRFNQKALAEIFSQYGDVARPYQVAARIIDFRKKQRIKTTFQLKEAIGIKNPKHLAKVFQALRIYLNQELVNLHSALMQAKEMVQQEGRIAVISYHSGEDRIVKEIFRNGAKEGTLQLLTKKPLTASKEEIENNPKARSAKLRVAKKI